MGAHDSYPSYPMHLNLEHHTISFPTEKARYDRKIDKWRNHEFPEYDISSRDWDMTLPVFWSYQKSYYKTQIHRLSFQCLPLAELREGISMLWHVSLPILVLII